MKKRQVSSVVYTLLSLSVLSFLLVSCGTKEDLTKTDHTKTNQVLRINFDENINSLNPLDAKTKSELFVRSMVFQPFLNSDATSDIIESIELDSINQTYLFKLYSHTRFNDDSLLTTKHIQSLFSQLFLNYKTKPVVSNLLSIIKGGKYFSQQLNQNVVNPLPRGFNIIDELNFSISTTTKDTPILELLSAEFFSIHKTINNKFIGTASFQLDQLNEDRACTLTKNIFDQKGINQILIRFIKNQTVLLSEFKLNELDLISYDSYPFDSTETTLELNTTIYNPYPSYQVFKTKRSTIRYAHISAVDSVQIQKILLSFPKLNKDSEILVYSSLTNAIEFDHAIWNNIDLDKDSTQLKVSIQSFINIPFDEYFITADSSRLTFITDDEKIINPSLPKIVINETKVISSDEQIQLNQLQNDNFVVGQLNVLIRLSDYPEFYIVNNNLKGLNNFQSLESQLNRLYFSKPKKY